MPSPNTEGVRPWQETETLVRAEALAARVTELDDDAFTLLALHVRPAGITRELYAECVRSGVFDLEVTERNLTVSLLAVEELVLRGLLVDRSNRARREGGLHAAT